MPDLHARSAISVYGAQSSQLPGHGVLHVPTYLPPSAVPSQGAPACYYASQKLVALRLAAI